MDAKLKLLGNGIGMAIMETEEGPIFGWEAI
jgi:hypothetical protein